MHVDNSLSRENFKGLNPLEAPSNSVYPPTRFTIYSKSSLNGLKISYISLLDVLLSIVHHIRVIIHEEVYNNY